MADWAIYWRDYAEESGTHGYPVVGWNTSREWLVSRLSRGDRIWLFTGGDQCGMRHRKRGYLAEVFFVEGWHNHPNFDPRYPKDCPRYEIQGDVDRCFLLDPPMLIDDIIRQADMPRSQHIGVARMTPHRLDDGAVAALLRRLQEEYPDAYAEICGQPV